MAIIVPSNGGGGVSNGAIINGVASFWQDTPPATRVGGDALVTGDQWYKPVDNGDEATAGYWIWRTGVGWVTAQLYALTINPASFGSYTTTQQLYGNWFTRNVNTRLFVECVIFNASVNTTLSDANYWTVSNTSFGLSYSTTTTNGWVAGVPKAVRISRQAVSVTPPNSIAQITYGKTGTPGNLVAPETRVLYRPLHP